MSPVLMCMNVKLLFLIITHMVTNVSNMEPNLLVVSNGDFIHQIQTSLKITSPQPSTVTDATPPSRRIDFRTCPVHNYAPKKADVHYSESPDVRD